MFQFVYNANIFRNLINNVVNVTFYNLDAHAWLSQEN